MAYIIRHLETQEYVHYNPPHHVLHPSMIGARVFTLPEIEEWSPDFDPLDGQNHWQVILIDTNAEIEYVNHE